MTSDPERKCSCNNPVFHEVGFIYQDGFSKRNRRQDSSLLRIKTNILEIQSNFHANKSRETVGRYSQLAWIHVPKSDKLSEQLPFQNTRGRFLICMFFASQKVLPSMCKGGGSIVTVLPTYYCQVKTFVMRRFKTRALYWGKYSLSKLRSFRIWS